MKSSKYIRVATVLFAGTLFGAYVVYSQLARNPQAANSRQLQQRAVSGPSVGTNVPARNSSMVAPGSKSRAPLLPIQTNPQATKSNVFFLPPSSMMASSTKTIVLDPKLTQRLITPAVATNSSITFTKASPDSDRPAQGRIMDMTSKSAGPSLARQASILITNSPAWTNLFNSNNFKLSR